ncbi:unnamed protein product, partial [Tenebrio molitor]
KTNIKRVFPVIGEGEVVNPSELYRKYARLRPANVPHEYFFISYRKAKCTVQRVSVHSFGKMPSTVAEFLKLPRPEEYTGHCFRRSSAILAADADVDLTSLKRLGGWKSSKVVEGYIEESLEKKKKVCKLLMGEKKTISTDKSPSTSSITALSNFQIALTTTPLQSSPAVSYVQSKITDSNESGISFA